MKRAPILFAFVCLLASCNRPQALSVDALAAEPARLRALRAQCLRGEHDDVFCAGVDQADLRRFLSGQAGPGEYQTLADLPQISASFDGPSAPTEERP